MPHGPFTRVAARQTIRPSHVNVLQVALENAPTLAEVGGSGGGMFLNAKSLGAMGDGVTNDGPILQSALNTLRDRAVGGWKGGVLFLPYGNYMTSQQIVVPTQVIIVGEGRGATAISATTTFPINTALIVLGQASGYDAGIGLTFGTRIENMGIDCLNRPGSIGVQSSTIQEQSGLHRVGIYNFMDKGVYINGSGGAAQNFTLHDLEIYGSASAPNLTGIHFNLVKPAAVNQVTIIHNAASAGTGFGFNVEASEVTVSNIGTERWSSGVLVQNGSSITITGLRGRFITENLLYLASSGVANTRIVAQNIGNSSSDITLGYLYDQATNTYHTSPVTHYEGGSSIGARIFTGAGTPESNIVGRVGDLYLRTDGGATTTLYVKTSGSTTNTGWTAK